MNDQISANDTIFALASGALPSGVALVRISGRGAQQSLRDLTGAVPPARQMRLCSIRGGDGQLIDRGLSVFFPAPASFTGEDCAELHLHGGRAVVTAALRSLAAMEGFRAAEAGEFTRRAFLNGKLDLPGVEALGDLIAAETETQRRFAIAAGSDRHRALYGLWRKRLIDACARVEATLDFADEGDVADTVDEAVWADIAGLRSEIVDHMGGFRDAEIIRHGFHVVILGAPNAGKSSLLNALARRDVAIVSDQPGTTRDLLEVALDIDGAKIVITDTAGLRAAPGTVEKLGVERAWKRAADADLVVLLIDAAQPVDVAVPEVPVLRVASKIDRAKPQPALRCTEAISAVTGAGIAALISALGAAAARHTSRATDILPFRERHMDLLRDACEQLALAQAQDAMMPELRAEALRQAAVALGRIAGTIDVEDLLDRIFAEFCIGK